jgi:hypothetical protein
LAIKEKLLHLEGALNPELFDWKNQTKNYLISVTLLMSASLTNFSLNL